jgi:uncharacterized protein YrzB (UPF0473 family)
MNQIKAIQLNDKIIIFINGKRQIINKKTSPETFEEILNLIKLNQTDKILNKLNNLEDRLKDFLKDFFNIEIQENKKYKIFDKQGNEYFFSSLIIRKSIEMIEFKENAKTLKSTSDKIIKHNDNFKNSNLTNICNNFYKKIDKIYITKLGNVIIPIVGEHHYKDKEVVGKPIKIQTVNNVVIKNKYNPNTRCIKTPKENEINNGYILINPYDIQGYTNEDTINVSRFQFIKEVDKDKYENGLYTIDNEELFDIPYKIIKKIEKNI